MKFFKWIIPKNVRITNWNIPTYVDEDLVESENKMETIEEYEARKQQTIERGSRIRLDRTKLKPSQQPLERSQLNDLRKNDIRPIETKTAPKNRGCGCGKRSKIS